MDKTYLEKKDTRSPKEVVEKIMQECQPKWIGVPAICHVADLPPFKVYQLMKRLKTFSFRWRGVAYYCLRTRVPKKKRR